MAKMKFTQLPEVSKKFPAKYKHKVSQLISQIVTDTIDRGLAKVYQNRAKIVYNINHWVYAISVDDAIPPIETIQVDLNLDGYDDFFIETKLNHNYINVANVEWDIDLGEDPLDLSVPPPIPKKIKQPKLVYHSTSKSDLYLRAPEIPIIDLNNIAIQYNSNGNKLAVYNSLPAIPLCQNQISCTTDVNLMTDEELLNLYPKNIIQTRFSKMYEVAPKIKFSEYVGNILPIKGFTNKQLLDNIIKYPHFYKMRKLIDGELVPFYTTIEIDGELHNTMEVWDNLPESGIIPRNSEYIKDYVLRRYLLERDIKKIDHKYKLFGEYNEFITLFAPYETYIEMGYKDIVGIAKKCVESRVKFRQSRNPIYRGIEK